MKTRARSRPDPDLLPLAGVAIPTHVVAYAAGVRSSGADWPRVREVLYVLNFGSWPIRELEDAVLDWLYEHTAPESGIFRRALCGTA